MNKCIVLVLIEGNEERLIFAKLGKKYFTIPKKYSFLAAKFTSVFSLSRYLKRLSENDPELASRIKSIDYNQLKKEA